MAGIPDLGHSGANSHLAGFAASSSGPRQKRCFHQQIHLGGMPQCQHQRSQHVQLVARKPVSGLCFQSVLVVFAEIAQRKKEYSNPRFNPIILEYSLYFKPYCSIALYFITMSRQTVGHWSAKPCCEIH